MLQPRQDPSSGSSQAYNSSLGCAHDSRVERGGSTATFSWSNHRSISALLSLAGSPVLANSACATARSACAWWLLATTAAQPHHRLPLPHGQRLQRQIDDPPTLLRSNVLAGHQWYLPCSRGHASVPTPHSESNPEQVPALDRKFQTFPSPAVRRRRPDQRVAERSAHGLSSSAPIAGQAFHQIAAFRQGRAPTPPRRSRLSR